MKTKLIAFLCVLALLFGFSGCTSESGTAEPEVPEEWFVPALDPQTEGEVRISANYNNFESLEAQFDVFQQYYPSIQLSYTKLDDYNNVISTALEGADAPDIYAAFTWMEGREPYSGVFTHAEDLSDPALGIDIDCIRESVLFRNADGTVPMAPVFTTTYGMLINEDLFKKEGLGVPWDYPALIDVCRAFREKGYETPLLGYDEEQSIIAILMNPFFLAQIAEDPDAVAQLNAMDPAAAELYRPSLEMIRRFADDGFLNMDACHALEDGYSALILRFFEGDIPMMLCTGDTVSGTQKRESQSEAFTAEPFSYSFVPVPITEEGGYFVDSPSMYFAVNKDSVNLEAANEFMRFLICPKSLGEMAQAKRLLNPTKDLTLDSVYVMFAMVPEERVLSPILIGIKDDPLVQLRRMGKAVFDGTMSIDEAIAAFGTF